MIHESLLFGRFISGIQSKSDTVRAQLVVGIGHFDAYSLIAFLHGGQNSGTRTRKGIQDSTTGHTNLDYISHEL